ncbi:hypothetical protein [Roseovarius sp. M141]|uniref:hypothetical protein n=1 Tax=Roseovarius sp. M141 TaxID=2583806 RepID=UPI0020CFB942|nr:hypothetical protein [Roseovarius sp. M141]MCQ0090811.1 hypothetical protein [Roseovarius sp. M141]
MPPPELETDVTQKQVDAAVNIDDFEGAVPGKKKWHNGLFEPWAMEFGYKDGMPVYGECVVGEESHHIYWLNDKHQAPIILKKGQTPADYGITPDPE